MKPKNTDIYFTPPPCPKVVKPYLLQAAIDALHGRDSEFCSNYMKSKLDDYPWEAHGLKKPTLHAFSRWVMAVAKNEGGMKKDGKKKSVSFEVYVSKKIIKEIISDTKNYVDEIQDSFLGSPKHLQLCDKYKKRGVPIEVTTRIIITSRKGDRSKTDGQVYVYRPAPKSRPKVVKVGFSAGDPFKRMHRETRNTRSENPQMLGWFCAKKGDESRMLEHPILLPYKVLDVGNQEVFDLPEISLVTELFKKEVEEKDGIIF